MNNLPEHKHSDFSYFQVLNKITLKNFSFCLLLFCLSTITSAFAQESVDISSPDQNLKVQLKWNSGKPVYNISYNDRIFLEDSPLGLRTSFGDLSKDLRYISFSKNEIEETYEMSNAKFSKTTYSANELTGTFLSAANDTLDIIFRVSNNDVAYSYRIKGGNEQTNVIIHEEASGFNLPDEATLFLSSQALPMTGWEETKPSYEEEYLFDEPLGTASLNGVGFTFPGLFKLKDNGFLLISETGVDGSYVGSRLGEGNSEGLYKIEFPQKGENNGMTETFAAMATPAQTPWRTITLGESLKPIVESTIAFDLVKPKYEASKNYNFGRATWSWIVWQDNSINYEDQIKYIDLASALNFEYVLIDNWWDARIGYEKMEKLVKYANSRNVDVLLWYNSNGYWNNAPQTPQDKMNFSPARNKEMAWMQKIGVKGIKVDFFGGDKQHTMQLYEDILTDANNYGLGVTFHGCTLPRGWQRIFPNFVTSEAVLASENLVFRQDALDKHAKNATILPFTRNAVGAMDFAPVFLNDRLSQDQKQGTIRRTTDAFELATAILYFSPIQHFGLTPNNLQEQPEFVLDFLREVPAVWDETVFIDGELGKFAVLARRKGERWYVAAVNGEKKARSLNLELPMLDGKEIQLIYDLESKKAGQKKEKIENGKILIEMLPEGGALIISE